MDDAFFIGRLKRIRGQPRHFDLTPFLAGPGTWEIVGWKIASTDEVEIYFSLENSTFILIMIKRAGKPNRSWYADNLKKLVETANEFLTPIDESRLLFVLKPYL